MMPWPWPTVPPQSCYMHICDEKGKEDGPVPVRPDWSTLGRLEVPAETERSSSLFTAFQQVGDICG